IALLLALLMLVILLLAGGFLYFSLRVQLQQALDDALRFNAQQLLATVENENGRLVFGRGDVAADPMRTADDWLRLVMLDGTTTDSQGKFAIMSPVNPKPGPDAVFTTIEAADLTTQAATSSFVLPMENFQPQLRIVSLPVNIDGGQVAWVQVGRSMTALHSTLNDLLLLLLLLAPVLLLATALSGYWLAGRVLRPIETIRRQAAAMSAQDLQRRLNLALPDDEIGRLARTFDQMLDRLQASFQAQQRFVSDASHELRTPLAVIRGECDVTLECPRQAADYVEALQIIGDETSRMERLVTNLLWLVRSDSTQITIQCEVFDLADLLSVLVELLQPQATNAGVTLNVDLPAALPLQGDTDRLIQVFANLLENAFVYAPGSTVSIRATMQDRWVVVTIADTGPGIAPAHLPHLFERFYRVDVSRNRASGGSGLGLAIVQDIVRAHGGLVVVTSTLEKGTCFTVRLPASGG
ncbi:MAG: HAMP domain-containing histidine kinase, partial [Caldilineaceae bacterium]|nr:HAMP domain-containing histidine kinase [Caldilineaceae bacterium]